MKWSTINNQYVSFRLSLRRGVTPHFLSPPLITPQRWFTAGATESNYMVVKILCLFSHYFRIKNLSVMGRQTHHSKDIIWEMMKYSLDSDTTTHFSPRSSGRALQALCGRMIFSLLLDYFIRFSNIIRGARACDPSQVADKSLLRLLADKSLVTAVRTFRADQLQSCRISGTGKWSR